ncbi:hypothetical protein PRIPAC_83272, partial [Pristionchus pacificus]|uniref:Helicase n=1 Tax=Pristionchus pacificus TaxID=54126 RepID=A0A2A6BM87_PRIPA
LARRATKFAEGTLVKCKIAYGECAFFQQKKRVEKVILIGRHYCRPLEQTQYLVLDEADRMLDMGFAEEVMEIMEKGGIAGKEDLRLLFSATFPKTVQSLAKELLREERGLDISGVDIVINYDMPKEITD